MFPTFHKKGQNKFCSQGDQYICVKVYFQAHPKKNGNGISIVVHKQQAHNLGYPEPFSIPTLKLDRIFLDGYPQVSSSTGIQYQFIMALHVVLMIPSI